MVFQFINLFILYSDDWKEKHVLWDPIQSTLLHDIATVINIIGGISTFFSAISAAGEILTLLDG